VIPTEIPANMKIMFLGSDTKVLNLMIATAPMIPKPTARLFPTDMIIMEVTIELKTIAWKK
jgi:hypothetical protein